MSPFPAAAGVYELLLRFRDGVEELRITDQLDHFCQTDGSLVFGGHRWAVIGDGRPTNPRAVGRLVCQRLDPVENAAPPVRAEPPRVHYEKQYEALKDKRNVEGARGEDLELIRCIEAWRQEIGILGLLEEQLLAGRHHRSKESCRS